jgi:hypothetical protein
MGDFAFHLCVRLEDLPKLQKPVVDEENHQDPQKNNILLTTYIHTEHVSERKGNAL